MYEYIIEARQVSNVNKNEKGTQNGCTLSRISVFLITRTVRIVSYVMHNINALLNVLQIELFILKFSIVNFR